MATRGYEDALAAKTEEMKPQCQAEADEVRGARRALHLRHRAPRVAPHRQPSCAAAPAARANPGESRFFLSAEDDVIRLFAGDRIFKILDRLGPVDDDGTEVPLEAKMLSENRRERAEEGRGTELPDPQTPCSSTTT